MDYHSNCDTLSIYSFHKILENEDYRYMLKSFDLQNEYANKISLSQEDELILKNAFKKIMNEYSELTKNRKLLLNYKELIEITYLTAKHDILTEIINSYVNTGGIVEVLVLAKELGYSLDLKKPISPQVERMLESLKGLRNKIRIKQINYDNKYSKNKNDVRVNLEKEALMLEINLKIGREIDIKKTSVRKWVYLVEINKEKAEHYG